MYTAHEQRKDIRGTCFDTCGFPPLLGWVEQVPSSYLPLFLVDTMSDANRFFRDMLFLPAILPLVTTYVAIPLYGASKAFVLSFSEALWARDRGNGVRMLVLCPGPTSTNFFTVVETPEHAVGQFCTFFPKGDGRALRGADDATREAARRAAAQVEGPVRDKSLP